MERINQGEIQSSGLAEALAADLGRILTQMGAQGAQLPALGYCDRLRAAGQIALRDLGLDGALRQMDSVSDSARSICAFAIGASGLGLREKLWHLAFLADDPHMGVRENAWLGVRADICKAPREAIALLADWTDARSPAIRRFAIEATRPRGVWCAHIPELREDPGLAIELLDRARAEQEIYPRNALANWLNDASKTRPDWVAATLLRWSALGPAAPHPAMVARALRGIRKSAARVDLASTLRARAA